MMEEKCVGIDGVVGDGIVFNLQGLESVDVGDHTLRKLVEDQGVEKFLCGLCGDVIDGDVVCSIDEGGIGFLCDQCEKTC